MKRLNLPYPEAPPAIHHLHRLMKVVSVKRLTVTCPSCAERTVDEVNRIVVDILDSPAE